MKLVLLRHGESEWNKLNLFTGWTDVDLSPNGKLEAAQAATLLKHEGLLFDRCYTSYLKRAIHTLNIVLENMDLEWLPVIKTWKLNERHYGTLQGLNKSETAQLYGEDQVKIWRRSFDIAPPALLPTDPRNPQLQMPYSHIKEYDSLPLAESLATTIQRVVPYFETEIKPHLLSGQTILITAHGNSLRALIKYFDHLSNEEITTVNIPTAVLLVYEFDTSFNVIGKRYLGDTTLITQKINAVANQGQATLSSESAI